MSDSSQPERNSKYNWREVPRPSLPKRSPDERVRDFLEIYGLYDEAAAQAQASRCLQCPNPGCVSGCPLCNPIPQWMSLTAEGRFMEAAAVLGSVANMAEICSRLCPQEKFCEETCILNGVSDPVSIRDIEQFLTDYARAHGQVDIATPPPNGKRIAVVGSGPGGLACADELTKQGYAVTVFDSSLIPGGLLSHGMPAFRLEKTIVHRRVEIMQSRGVVFRLGVSLGNEITLGQLRGEFDAVYLGFDSRKARPLTIPGAGLKGVVQGLAFILQKNTPVPTELPPIDVTGRRVAVIGGGDMALDCLRTALRCGASSALGIYRREERDMPCTVHEYRNAVEEGCRFLFNAAPVAILGQENKHTTGVRLIRTEIAGTDTNGRRGFQTLPGSEFDVAADIVIAALGFDGLPCPHTGDLSILEINDWGGLVVDDDMKTNLPDVYAGGDIVRGPCMALHAVRDARRAAAAIHAKLRGALV